MYGTLLCVRKCSSYRRAVALVDAILVFAPSSVGLSEYIAWNFLGAGCNLFIVPALVCPLQLRTNKGPGLLHMSHLQ